MGILHGYAVGRNILRLIKKFWDYAVLACGAEGNFGAPFKAYLGVIKGGPLSPKLFNILVDAVMRECL